MRGLLVWWWWWWWGCCMMGVGLGRLWRGEAGEGGIHRRRRVGGSLDLVRGRRQ